MSFLQIGSPLGVVLGYTLTMLIIRADVKWQFSFIIQAIIFALFTIVNICLPKIFFSKSLKCINPTNFYLEEHKKNEKRIRVEEKKNLDEENNNKNDKELKAESFENDHEGEENKNAVIESNKEKIEEKLEDIVSLYQHKVDNDDKLKTFWRNLCRLARIKVIKNINQIINITIEI
jgi:hypothetical protein